MRCRMPSGKSCSDVFRRILRIAFSPRSISSLRSRLQSQVLQVLLVLQVLRVQVLEVLRFGFVRLAENQQNLNLQNP